MGDDFKELLCHFSSSLVSLQKNPHLSRGDDEVTSSFWTTDILGEHVPNRHRLKIYLSLSANVLRKSNSKLELGGHEGRALP